VAILLDSFVWNGTVKSKCRLNKNFKNSSAPANQMRYSDSYLPLVIRDFRIIPAATHIIRKPKKRQVKRKLESGKVRAE